VEENPNAVDAEEEVADKNSQLEHTQLAVHAFACVHTSHILCFERNRVSDLALPEELFARGIALIAGYSSRRVSCWSPKTLGLAQVFAGSVLNKFAVSSNTFQRDINHAAWDNMFAVFNVYRNLTWCPMPLRTTQESMDGLVQWLLSSPATGTVAPNSQQLVMEHTVAILCNFLAQLKLFDLEALPGNAAEEARVRTIQASGLAFMSYFRDLLGCLGTARKQAPEARDAVIRHFFATYHFSRVYSKDEVDRVRALDENEARRRRTLMSREAVTRLDPQVEENRDETKKQRVRDFEALDRGVTVWNMSDNSGTQQCYLYLKRAEKNSGMLAQLIDKGKPKNEALAYNVVIEAAKKKIVLSLFDQTQVYLGACTRESLGELEYARNMCVKLRWKRGFGEVKVDFGCTSSDDFEMWARCVAFLAWSRNEVGDMGSAVELNMWLHARGSTTDSSTAMSPKANERTLDTPPKKNPHEHGPNLPILMTLSRKTSKDCQKPHT